MTETRTTIRLADGRSLSYLDLGDPAGVPVLFTIGTPSSAHGGRAFAGAAERNGVRLLSIDKPGYGNSSRHPKRPLLSFGGDVRALADSLGLERVAIAGQSGGGPHALAAASVLGDRVTTLTLISSGGPMHQPWARKGMNPLMQSTTWCANHAPWLMPLPVGLVKFTGADPDRAQKMVARGARKATERERAEMTRPETRYLLEGIGEAFASGIGAACDEFRAIGQPWGFRLEDIQAPTDMWHGTSDKACPIAMARELARRLPRAQLHELEGLGHSFFGPELEAVMAKLATSAAHS